MVVLLEDTGYCETKLIVEAMMIRWYILPVCCGRLHVLLRLLNYIRLSSRCNFYFAVGVASSHGGWVLSVESALDYKLWKLTIGCRASYYKILSFTSRIYRTNRYKLDWSPAWIAFLILLSALFRGLTKVWHVIPINRNRELVQNWEYLWDELLIWFLV